MIDINRTNRDIDKYNAMLICFELFTICLITLHMYITEQAVQRKRGTAKDSRLDIDIAIAINTTSAPFRYSIMNR